jgi:hypothetical protein
MVQDARQSPSHRCPSRSPHDVVQDATQSASPRCLPRCGPHCGPRCHRMAFPASSAAPKASHRVHDTMSTRSLRLAPAAIGSEHAEDLTKKGLCVSFEFIFSIQHRPLCFSLTKAPFLRERCLPDLAWIRRIAELNNFRWVVDVCRSDGNPVQDQGLWPHLRNHLCQSLRQGHPLDFINSVASASARYKSFDSLLNALVMPVDGIEMP